MPTKSTTRQRRTTRIYWKYSPEGLIISTEHIDVDSEKSKLVNGIYNSGDTIYVLEYIFTKRHYGQVHKIKMASPHETEETAIEEQESLKKHSTYENNYNKFEINLYELI